MYSVCVRVCVRVLSLLFCFPVYCSIKDILMQALLLSGYLEPQLLGWLFIFHNPRNKVQIFFTMSENSHSYEDAHVVMKYPCFDVKTS